MIGRWAAGLALEQHEENRENNCGIRSAERGYFSSAAVEVAGPSPMIRRTASSSLAPSQCTCLPKCVTKLPAGIGVVLAGSNFGPEPTHPVPCRTAMQRSLGWTWRRLEWLTLVD